MRNKVKTILKRSGTRPGNLSVRKPFLHRLPAGIDAEELIERTEINKTGDESDGGQDENPDRSKGRKPSEIADEKQSHAERHPDRAIDSSHIVLHGEPPLFDRTIHPFRDLASSGRF